MCIRDRDIPECGLVAILDADKEGFLRSETSLVQTIGRAARNSEGRVIMYADRVTGSMERALQETNRRREKQHRYNLENDITPETIKKNVRKHVEAALEETGGLLRLAPAWVPRSFLQPGLRLKLKMVLSRVGIAAGDSSNIFKTPEVYYAGLCGQKYSISLYANLCEAFGPCFCATVPLF